MPSVFKNNSHIQIRLIRSDDAEQDDQIVIRSKGEGLYQIYFRDGNTAAEKPGTYCTILSGEELDTYLESLYTLLVRDGDPFTEIQFNIPCYPTLIYPIQQLRRGKIRKTLRSVLPLLSSAVKI